MSVQAPNAERQIWIFTQMLRIREFEERVKRSFTEHPGVIRGHTHLADGAEASIVGTLAHFRSGDAALATYRCHGYPLVLGTDATTAADAVDYLAARMLRVPLAPATREAFVAFLGKELGTDSLDRARSYMEDALRMTTHLIMSTPEYQLV